MPYSPRSFPLLIPVLLGSAMVMGCPSDDAGGESETSDTTETTETTETSATETSATETSATETGPAECSSASDCDACLALEGCNWTGGSCEDMCLQDTDCYGPGSGALICPGTDTDTDSDTDTDTGTDTDTSTDTDTDTDTDTTGALACDGEDCDACLAIDGCNWTADACADECVQDADCFGPGNPEALTCPG